MNIRKRPAYVILTLLALSLILLLVCCRGTGKTEEQPPAEIGVPPETVVSEADDAAEPEAPEEPKETSATIMMAGDYLIHSLVYQTARVGETKTYDFSPFFQAFGDVFTADLNIMNMEVPVDAYGDNKKLSSYPRFNCPLEGAQAAKEMGVQLCITCNNHCCDQFWEGMLKSRENLRNMGFDTVGTYASPEENAQPYIRDVNGIKVGVVAFTESTNGLNFAKHDDYAINRLHMKSPEEVLERAEQLREAGAEYVIAVLHWGTEYTLKPSGIQVEFAHALCDGGVDLIMGSHPHFVQPIELYTAARADGSEKKCLVIYSLGNFFADHGRSNHYLHEGMVTAVKLRRGEDGDVTLEDSFYVPTVVYRARDEKLKYHIKLLPAGDYMDGDGGSGVFVDKSGEAQCRNAWNAVQKTVGDDIPAVTGPKSYPEGFFAENKE